VRRSHLHRIVVHTSRQFPSRRHADDKHADAGIIDSEAAWVLFVGRRPFTRQVPHIFDSRPTRHRRRQHIVAMSIFIGSKCQGMDVQGLLDAMGMRNMFRFADPDIERKRTPRSPFDRDYVKDGHGEVPVSRQHMPPKEYTIELKAGDNPVKLLPCSALDQLRNIEVSPADVDLTLTKTSFAGGNDAIVCTTRDLMTCRTLLVPYRDTYTKLSIHAAAACTITINPSKPKSLSEAKAPEKLGMVLQYKEYKIDLTPQMHEALLDQEKRGFYEYVDQGVRVEGRDNLIRQLEQDLPTAPEPVKILNIAALNHILSHHPSPLPSSAPSPN